MENQLTKEQALNNIRVVVEAFRGTKQEHIILELSLKLLSEDSIVENVKTEEVLETA